MQPSLEKTDLPAQVVAERTQLFLPSLTRWIEPTVEYLKQKAVLVGACQESRTTKLMVALHEALTNSVIHGNLELSSEAKEQGDSVFAEALAEREANPALASRTVDILVDYDGERCHWVLTDQGKGFDIQAVLQRCLSEEPEDILASGRGILLMRSFLDEVKYELNGRRVILTLRHVSGAESRTDARVSMHQPLRVVPLLPDGTPDWDAAYEAVSRNFSERGMALLLEGRTPAGSMLIGLNRGTEMLYIPAEVRHVRALAGDIVEVGCRFRTKLELSTSRAAAAEPEDNPELKAVQEAIAELLHKHAQPTGALDERRVHPRVIYNERIDILTGPTNQPHVGFCRDLSKGGIAFITLQPLPDKVTLVFMPVYDDNMIRVHAQVVRCAKVKEGFYDAGACFLHLEKKAGKGG